MDTHLYNSGVIGASLQAIVLLNVSRETLQTQTMASSTSEDALNLRCRVVFMAISPLGQEAEVKSAQRP